jgi:glucoamylase
MPRDIPVGNGCLLVAFDAKYRLADIYFPHVGHENHGGSRFRFGIWADDVCSWIEDDRWHRTLGYLRDTIVSDVLAENGEIGLRLRCHDAVDADENVYVRKIVVRNLRDDTRTIKVFFHHDFNLYGTPTGDTAMYDPDSRSIIHYKARRYFLVGGGTDSGWGIDEYACGRSGIGGSEGTWRDAEDGALSMNAIQQGAVDSTIAVSVALEPHGTANVYHWICAGERYGDVRQLDRYVRDETPSRVISRTASLWYTWVHKNGDDDVNDLPEELRDLYRRSLLVVQTQSDGDGGILAANDSDIEWSHNDHYSYVWPRDGAFVADAMDRAGFHTLARRFIEFANDAISNDGYFLHKYAPDGSVASAWNPWVRHGKKQLPIQEDETALVMWLVARHYDRTRDLEFVRAVYRRLIVQPAEFMIDYRDPATLLPKPSFDIWEERQGVFTFTCAAVSAGLRAAAHLANLFNEQDRRARYTRAANEVRDTIVRHLWLEQEGRFARGLVLRDDDTLAVDATIDASAFATFYLDVFPAESAMVDATMRAIREKLWVSTETGGVARYENDRYHRATDETSVPGNPWLICTLWLAEHAIARATTIAELQSALDLLRWARSKARPSLILPEQIDPETGAPLSVAPFTWSHAQVVSVVHGYLDALRVLRLGASENSEETSGEITRDHPVDKPKWFS